MMMMVFAAAFKRLDDMAKNEAEGMYQYSVDGAEKAERAFNLR